MNTIVNEELLYHSGVREKNSIPASNTSSHACMDIWRLLRTSQRPKLLTAGSLILMCKLARGLREQINSTCGQGISDGGA